MSLCITIFASAPILNILSVKVHVYNVPKFHRLFPPFNLLRSVGPGRCLFTNFFSAAAMSQTALCLFSLFKDFFVGATNLVLQQQLSQLCTRFICTA